MPPVWDDGGVVSERPKISPVTQGYRHRRRMSSGRGGGLLSTPMNFFRAEGGLFQFVWRILLRRNSIIICSGSSSAATTAILRRLVSGSSSRRFNCRAPARRSGDGARSSCSRALPLPSLCSRVRPPNIGARQNYAASCAAVALVAIFIYQPFMSDLLSWTFLVFQLIWILFSALALFSLLRLIRYPDRKRWIWAAVIFAYASMHALGLGLATVAATALILATLLFGIRGNKLNAFRSRKPTIVPALSLLIVFSLAHALCMILLNGPPPPRSLPLGTSLDSGSPLVRLCRA